MSSGTYFSRSWQSGSERRRQGLDGYTAKICARPRGVSASSDGPFAETKEIMGGVFLVDLPDLDEAIRLAALVPSARHGSIEIRPVLQ
jgi:hypothetical protein